MQLYFYGATQEVTGSCFLLEFSDKRVLIDCGLLQGSQKHELHNFDPFPFDVHSIDAVLLTHAHIDHSGKLPLLKKRGFKGKIYTHHATSDLCNIMLQDAGFLNEKDVELENRKRERKGLDLIAPLYTVKDALDTMQFFETLDYDVKREILPNLSMRLNDAGHILGSAIIEVWVSEGGVTRKLVFSGDLGRKDMPILKNPAVIKEADLVIMESTYGDRTLPHWNETLTQFSEILHETSQTNGNILIPSFAVGRSQELLYTFFVNFDTLPLKNALIFLDSPMAVEVTKVYSRHWNLYDKAAKKIIKEYGSPYHLPNLRLCVSTEESMAINQIKQGAIIIAGSGMCDGGRIRHHMKHNIWRRNCHLIFVGYQAEGTLGRRILDGASEINLWGEIIQVKAKVHVVNSFSAHADQTGLLDWYGQFDSLPPIALVHGESSSIDRLAQEIYKRFTVYAWIPKFKDRYDLIKQKPIS